MKEVKYSCDNCNSFLTDESSLVTARSTGAMSLTITGRIDHKDSIHNSVDKHFCNVECLTEYLTSFAKELVAKNIVDQ